MDFTGFCCLNRRHLSEEGGLRLPFSSLPVIASTIEMIMKKSWVSPIIQVFGPLQIRQLSSLSHHTDHARSFAALAVVAVHHNMLSAFVRPLICAALAFSSLLSPQYCGTPLSLTSESTLSDEKNWSWRSCGAHISTFRKGRRR